MSDDITRLAQEHDAVRRYVDYTDWERVSEEDTLPVYIVRRADAAILEVAATVGRCGYLLAAAEDLLGRAVFAYGADEVRRGLRPAQGQGLGHDCGRIIASVPSGCYDGGTQSAPASCELRGRGNGTGGTDAPR